MNISIVKEFILDYVFPKYCFSCGREGSFTCPSCSDKIIPVITQVCPECKRISEAGKYCANDNYFVKKDSKTKKEIRIAKKLSGIFVSCYYEEGPIKELIHNFKYNNVTELSVILGEIMVKALKDNIDYIGKDVLVTAVPLHFLRKAQRGYNQSEILAEYVANKLNLQKNIEILQKIRKTKTQVKFSGKKRRENLKNSFRINPFFVAQASACSLKNRTIILVDDVTTTGTTLNECAKVLRKAGAKRVWGLVIAKG